MANSDKNTRPGSHLFVTVANQADGDIDQTNEVSTSTKFPVGFANNALFSGRAFPYKNYKTGRITAEGGNQNNGRYSTSYTNPLNACMTALCFQMFAEVADVDQLLSMIRSTCLTDHIHLDLNGDGDTNDLIDGHPETVPLQLINPAGFFKKYDMPTSLPKAISTSETIDLEKGYYKGMVFDIPGAEVLVNGEWIAFDAKNKDLILAQNPMDLEWRLNGTLLRKYSYTPGQTLQGQIITVDDQWNGLRLEKEFSVQVR